MTDEPTRRRRRLSAEQRREQIMEATVRVVARDGYQAATADAIAREAELSKGLLWHYFGNQDELMAQTARSTLQTLQLAVAESIDLDAPAPSVVRAAVRGAAGLLHSHGAERRAIGEIVLNLRQPDGAMRLTLREYDGLYAAQEGVFRRGQEQGHFAAELSPRVIAVTYQGAVDAMLEYLDTHPEADVAAHAATVADILLGGIATPAGRAVS